MNFIFKIDWTPDERRLRRSGWIGLVGFLALGGVASLIAPRTETLGIWVVFGALALACGALALISPKRLKPIYLLVMCIAQVVFFPVTLFLGIIGHDPGNPPANSESPAGGDFSGKAENIPDDGPSEE